MYLRSSSKNSPGNLNISRGRGKRIENSPNTSFSDICSLPSSRPRVVHSQPRCSSVPLSNSEHNQNPECELISQAPFTVETINTVENQETALNNTLSQTTTLLGFEVAQPPIMDSAGTNNSVQREPSRERIDTNSLIDVLNSIREVQASFVAELGSIRNTVFKLGPLIRYIE